MNSLTFSTISRWRVGKVKVINILKWCKVNCKGHVDHISNLKKSDELQFELEEDMTFFILRWR